MPWQIVHRCCLFESFFFLRGNIPHFLPGRTDQIEPEDRKRQESDAVVPNQEMASVWWTLLTYLRMFLKTQQSGGKMLRQAGSCVRLTLQVLVSVCCSSTYRKHQRGAQRGRRRAATPRSANKLGVKRERGSVSGVVFIPLCPLWVLRRFLLSWQSQTHKREEISCLDDDNADDNDL